MDTFGYVWIHLDTSMNTDTETEASSSNTSIHTDLEAEVSSINTTSSRNTSICTDDESEESTMSNQPSADPWETTGWDEQEATGTTTTSRIGLEVPYGMQSSNQAAAAPPLPPSRIGLEVPYGMNVNPQPNLDDRKEDEDDDSTLKASTASKPSVKVRPDPLLPSLAPIQQEEEKGAQLSPEGSLGSEMTCQEAEEVPMEETGAKMKDTNPLNQDVDKRRKPPFPPKAKEEMLKDTQSKSFKAKVPMEFQKQVVPLEDEFNSISRIISGEVEEFTRLYTGKSLEFPSNWYEEKYNSIFTYLNNYKNHTNVHSNSQNYMYVDVSSHL